MNTRVVIPDFYDLLPPKPQAKMASGFQQRRGFPNQRLQTTHCPYRYKVKRLWLLGARKLLESAAGNFNPRHSADPADLFQEGSLLCDRFKKDNVEVWGNQLDRKSWEASATTDIEQASSQLDYFRNEEALAEVPRNTFLGRPNGGQIDFPVPSDQQVKIDEEFVYRFRREREVKGRQQLTDSNSIEHWNVL